MKRPGSASKLEGVAGETEGYEQRAEEAEAQARRATSEEERESHLKVAKLWRELAQRRSAQRSGR